MFTITSQALEIMTIPQRDALIRLANERVQNVSVQRGGFDLPEMYLAFRQDYKEGTPIFGGISPNGDVST